MALRASLRACIENIAVGEQNSSTGKELEVLDIIQGNEVSPEVQEELVEALKHAGGEIENGETVSVESQQQDLEERFKNSKKLYIITPDNYDSRLISDIVDEAKASDQEIVLTLVDRSNYPEESSEVLDEAIDELKGVGVKISESIQDTANQLVKGDEANIDDGDTVDENAA